MPAGFTVAAIFTGISNLTGWWLRLHLFFVGRLLSAISATSQVRAVTWSSTPPPGWTSLARNNGGSVAGALLVGRKTALQWMFIGGGATVVIAIIALAAIRVAVRRHAVGDRFAPAIAAYVAAIAAGTVGCRLG